MLKRIINLVISLSVGAADWLKNQVGGVLGRRPRGCCVVLAYHSVTPQERAQFARQMDVLTRCSKPIRADIQSLPGPGEDFAAITFDDGLQCVVDNALPELAKRGIPSTLFIVTEVLGGHPGWQNFESVDPTQELVMSEQQLRQLPSELVTIGSHTMTHPVLPSVDDKRLEQELRGSREKLEKIINREVKLFSFPYGAFDERVVEWCRETGYGRVFTALPVFALSEPQEFVTGRVGVNATDWPIEFRLKLAGAYRWLPYAYIWKRKIKSALSGRAAQDIGSKPKEERVA